MLAHLKQLQALAVKGKHQGHGEPLQEHSFPGQLAAVQTLRTLHIDTIANGVSTVDDAISKLSRLQELHLLAKVMRAATIAPAQICKAAYDDHLVLQELILLPKLRSLAESCGIEELPDVLHSCTQLTFFCFQGRQSDFHLHIGSYLKNLEEIAIQNYLANASLLEQTTRVQLFFTTVLIVMACCVKLLTDICSLAMSVSNSYRNVCVVVSNDESMGCPKLLTVEPALD